MPEINLVPTDAMAAEAERGLAWREEYGRGGTAVGVARARDISNKKELSADTIGRMVSYFARHEVDKQAEGFSPGEEGYPSAGRIAWALWGGDPGKSWANAKYDQLNKDKAMSDTKFIKAALKVKPDEDYVAFIASTSDEDRMGDIIRQEGWKLDKYKANPVVLFSHDHDKPIGRAHNVRVEGGSLKADIEFASEEVDPFAAKIGRMVKSGFLRAVSVGFKPLEMKPIKSGLEFIKSELLEISVVSVPANASALAYAKSFMDSSELSRVFAADPVQVRKDAMKAAYVRLMNKDFSADAETKSMMEDEEGFPSAEELDKNFKNVLKNWNLGPEKASPLPDANPEYWANMAEAWGVDEAQARRQLCANCEYFNNTPDMMAKMESAPINKFDRDGGGRGFCVKFDFICHNLRTCQAWEEKDFMNPDSEDGPTWRASRTDRNQ